MTDDGPAPHPILEAIATIEDVSILADELIDACGTIEVALMVMGRIEDGIRTLQTIRSLLDTRTIELRGRDRAPLPVPGGGTYKVSGGDTKDVYDNDRLAGAVARATIRKLDAQALITTSGDTCPIDGPVEIVVRSILAMCGATAPSFSAWRSGAARDLGIDLAGYRTRTTTNLRGRIEGRGPR